MTKETCSCGAAFDGPVTWADEFRERHKHDLGLATLQAERDRYRQEAAEYFRLGQDLAFERDQLKAALAAVWESWDAIDAPTEDDAVYQIVAAIMEKPDA